MERNTSVSLGDHFENCIHEIVSEGRCKNAIREKIDGGIERDFDPETRLRFQKMPESTMPNFSRQARQSMTYRQSGIYLRNMVGKPGRKILPLTSKRSFSIGRKYPEIATDFPGIKSRQHLIIYPPIPNFHSLQTDAFD